MIMASPAHRSKHTYPVRELLLLVTMMVIGVSSCTRHNSYNKEMEQDPSGAAQNGRRIAHNAAAAANSSAGANNVSFQNNTLAREPIFYQISSYLYPREKARLACTSKAINQVSYTAQKLDFAADHTDRYRGVTDSQLSTLIPKYATIKHLNLHGCDNLTDAGVRTIAQHCPKLTRLDLSRCYNLTDAGVQAIAQHCTQLMHLDLGHCNNITDAGVQAIA